MAVPPQVATPDDVLSAGVEALLARWPAALPFVNTGTGAWSNIVRGLRAQCALALARVADGVSNGRLYLATGDTLADLVASEFDAIAPGTQTAVGEVVLTRASTAAGGGTIPAGTRFRIPAVTVGPITRGGIDCVSVLDTRVDATALTVTVRIDATVDGAKTNIPIIAGQTASDITISDTLFDKTLLPTAYTLAGGSDGPGDDLTRMYAAAFILGQYGPTADAAFAGILKNGGVRYFRAVDSGGTLSLYIADASWGSGTSWAAKIQQALYDSGFVGFGCKLRALPVQNKLINVKATVLLRDPTSLSDTSELDGIIQTALRDYFDKRPDWNIWKLSAMRGLVSRCDERILRCSLLQVLDSTGAPIAEPSATSAVQHYYLANNAVSVTYQGPT
jgi:hypothetical protein